MCYCISPWCVNVLQTLHVCPSRRQTRPPKVEWWLEQQSWASSGLIGLFFSQGMQAESLSLPLFFLSLSQMPPNILFLPLFKLFSPFLLPSSINKRLIWGKILKTLLTRRFDLVCVYFVEGCVGSGLELVTRQQQAWNSSSHRLLWQRGLCVCLGLGHNYHTNSHADTHCSFLT